jgi:hypothetical protein
MAAGAASDKTKVAAAMAIRVLTGFSCWSSGQWYEQRPPTPG